jgi:hypothetical protein
LEAGFASQPRAYGTMGLVEYEPPNNNAESSQWSECNLLTPRAGPRKVAVLESFGDKYFIICWSCYRNIILPTPLAAFFSTEELPKSRTASCKFAEFWVRFAWHHVLAGKGDIDTLLLGAGQIAASEQRCPNAGLKSDLDTKSPSNRVWYTIADPDSGDLLKQWTICGDCRSQIVKVCPPFEQTLKMVSTAPVRAMCDLVPKIAAVRSMICFKELINCEQAAHETDELDMRPLADFIKRFTNVPACPKDIPTSIPRKFYHIPGGSEYAICQDCYLTFIEPEASAGGVLAQEVLLSPKPMPQMTCQLYSERMRRVWADAVATSDKAFLLQKVCLSFTLSQHFLMILDVRA